MGLTRNGLALLALASALMLVGAGAWAAPVRFAGAECSSPPALHCPDKDCPSALVTNQGPVVEPKSGRSYFLDYPCDLKPGEKVVLVLALHGGGSYGNWQRNYFPIMDDKDKYRLVIATPNTRGWSPNDDAYLRNITSSLIDQIGRASIRSFWLVGHSMGGVNARRIVCDDFFGPKVDGFLSLSGGRVGSPIPAGDFIRAGPPRGAGGPPPGPPPGAPPPGAGGPNVRLPGGGIAITSIVEQTPLTCDFSHIFATGEFEASGQTLPATSTWATRFDCAARVKREEIADDKGGLVWDSTRQNPGSDGWGHAPKGGQAVVYQFPRCKGGRLVADVVRLGKGHTEGLEPRVTEDIVKLMVSAPGGKIRRGG